MKNRQLRAEKKDPKVAGMTGQALAVLGNAGAAVGAALAGAVADPFSCCLCINPSLCILT